MILLFASVAIPQHHHLPRLCGRLWFCCSPVWPSLNTIICLASVVNYDAAVRQCGHPSTPSFSFPLWLTMILLFASVAALHTIICLSSVVDYDANVRQLWPSVHNITCPCPGAADQDAIMTHCGRPSTISPVRTQRLTFMLPCLTVAVPPQRPLPQPNGRQ